jgi:hypothetical protein|nr:MAG TPA: hypothetical protein [Caudoviricetes sp.]
MTKSNETKSLPKVKRIHGVEIEKKPCGKYFEALQTLKDLPEDFIKELSDNGQDFKLSEMFTIENIMTLITRLLIVIPNFTFEFLSKLMEVDRDILENQLTPKELLDVIQEFWKVNELESFFDQMKPILNKITTLIGFKKQLPSA